MLKEVDLEGSSAQRAGELSGGQKRRLSVCVSLIGSPRVLVLDEPTTGVEPLSRRHIWNALKRRRRDRLILFTTHFMDEADLLAGPTLFFFSHSIYKYSIGFIPGNHQLEFLFEKIKKMT